MGGRGDEVSQRVDARLERELTVPESSVTKSSKPVEAAGAVRSQLTSRSARASELTLEDRITERLKAYQRQVAHEEL
jgi:hypothetical protein